MTRATAQIVITLTLDGQYKAEIPTANGGRKKIDLDSVSNWKSKITKELQALDHWLENQEKRKQEIEQQSKADAKLAKLQFSRRLHIKNWDNTARSHNRGGTSGTEFAKKTIGPRLPGGNAMDLLK
jgi:hypothetical protein